MPADVLGQLIYTPTQAAGSAGEFHFREGPVFTNLLLADEINRTPPKTQAALLEAMEERQVTIEGQARALPDPFIVIATQNPIEYEGTYPLPEAQLDRFLLKLHVGYPSADQEQEVLRRHDAGLDPHDVASARRARRRALPTSPPRGRWWTTCGSRSRCSPTSSQLARATRESASLVLGVSPRGSAMLLHAAKAWAWLSGREFVTPDEVKAMAKPALRHRVQLRPEVELEGVTVDNVLDGVLATVPVPR